MSRLQDGEEALQIEEPHAQGDREHDQCETTLCHLRSAVKPRSVPVVRACRTTRTLRDSEAS